MVFVVSGTLDLHHVLQQFRLNSDALLSFRSINYSNSYLEIEYEGNPIEYVERIEIQAEKSDPSHAATVICDSNVNARDICDLFDILMKISKVKDLSNPKEPLTAFEVYFSANETDISKLSISCREFGKKTNIDIAIQRDDIYRRYKRLVVFDMDSTLIEQECIDELAREAGVYSKVSSITDAAMFSSLIRNGSIDFDESLRQRVMLLKDQPVGIIDTVKANLVFKPGVQQLCVCLKRLGFKLAVLSGGFTPFTNQVKDILGLDYAFANNLLVSDCKRSLLGTVMEPILNASRKAELLNTIAHIENIPREQICAVGDGANDLRMLAAASVGIAFNAKPGVQEQTEFRLNKPSLLNILYYFGLNWKDIEQLSV